MIHKLLGFFGILLASMGSAWAVSDTVEIPVLIQPVKAGQSIAPDNVSLTAWSAKLVFPSTVKNIADLDNAQATHTIEAGSPISKLHVRIKPAVERDKAVQIVYRKPGVEVTGMGKALEDGKLGDLIKVQNTSTRTTLMGTVTEPGKVEVQ